MNAHAIGAAILTRLRASLRDLVSHRGAWAVRAMTAFCVGLGFWLRARGFLYDVPYMWVDECQWAILLVEQPLRELIIRPPAFMAVSKAMATLFGPTETPLRLLPWLAGLATLFVAPPLARRLFTAPAARLLFVAIIALHPAAIDLSKEFKPYSVSLALHLVLMLFTLRYTTERRTRDLAWLLGIAWAGVLFAQDALFALPGVFCLIGWSALKNERRHLRPIVLAAVAVIATLLLQYALIWKNMPKGDTEYWGYKYNVFFVDRPGVSYLSWLAGRYWGLTIFPGYHARYWGASWLPDEQWSNVTLMAQVVWRCLHFFGLLMFVWHRRVRAAILLILPLLVLLVFNGLGLWPFGVFRANAFLVAYLAAFAAMAFDAPANVDRPAFGLLPAWLLVLIPTLFFEDSWPPTKRAMSTTSDFPALLGWLHQQAPKGKQVIIISGGSCESWNYYLGYHPETRGLQSQMRRRFKVRCQDDDSLVLDELRDAIGTRERRAWTLGWRKPYSEQHEGLTRTRSVRFATKELSEWDTVAREKRHVPESTAPPEAALD